MLAVSVVGEQVKKVMGKLLIGTEFDEFLVRSADVRTFASFHISGVSSEEITGENVSKVFFCPWASLKPYVCGIIKGGNKPRYIKIIFALADSDTGAVHENSAALFLNLVYEADEIRFTTGSSQRSFSLDKSVNTAWDEYVRAFLKTNGWA